MHIYAITFISCLLLAANIATIKTNRNELSKHRFWLIFFSRLRENLLCVSIVLIALCALNFFVGLTYADGAPVQDLVVLDAYLKGIAAAIQSGGYSTTLDNGKRSFIFVIPFYLEGA